MPDADVEVALAVAERVRGLVADQSFTVSGGASELAVTISVGVATTREPTATTESLIGRADEALYRAKGRGRNCVASAEIDPPGLRHAGTPTYTSSPVAGRPGTHSRRKRSGVTAAASSHIGLRGAPHIHSPS